VRAAAAVAAAVLVGCSETPRTAINFCRVLDAESPGLATPPTSTSEVRDLVGRYERLLAVAPLEIEEPLRTVVDALRTAAEADGADPESVQAAVDAAYRSEADALAFGNWVRRTCGAELAAPFG
jgi:pectin methylesterase-like acyl-CoA thioesterase